MATTGTRTSRWGALATSVSVLVAGCTQQATEVIVIVDTDAPAARRLELRASVASGTSANPMRRMWNRAEGATSTISFPASFAIVPAPAGAVDTPVLLALGMHLDVGPAGEPAIDFERTARFTFVQHRTTVLRVFLSVRCGAASTGCAGVPDAECTVARRCADMRQTCSDTAECASVEVTPVPIDQDDAGSIARPDVMPIDAHVDGVAMDAPMDTAPVDVPAEACTGECTAGQTRTVSCGNCGMRTDTCSSSCMWTNGTCMNSGCTPGDTRTMDCGPCARQTDTCNSSCQWVAGSCSGSCCTPMGGCGFGNPIGAICAGNGDDGCGGPCTCNTDNGEACNVGSGYGSCCHTNGWFCANQGECCPGLTCTGNICS